MTVVGRFAPTPSGRMHMGNLFSALLAWLSVRSQKGELVLRMEDLDTQRTSPAYADRLRRDLEWLGLYWDRETPPPSRRTEAYLAAFRKLEALGLLYPCYCTRSRLHSVNAPHLSDGVYVYDGACRKLTAEQRAAMGRSPAWRVTVPEREIALIDGLQGLYREYLPRDCGDFVVRRADGVFVYQLAVVVDDGDAGVTEVVRGRDLLSSAPRQMYLQDLLGYPHPRYYHVPMLLSGDGRRLSKRDGDMDLGALSRRMTPEALLGYLSHWAGLRQDETPVDLDTLTGEFSWNKVRSQDVFASIAPCVIPER